MKLIGSTLDFVAFFFMCWGLNKLGALTNVPTSLPLFLLCVYALTTIIVDSKIAWPFSQLIGKLPLIGKGLYSENADGDAEGLLSCPLCTGMWVGPVLAWLGIAAFPVVSMVGYVEHGLISAGFAYAVSKVMHKFD